MVFEYAAGRIELFELPRDGDGYGGYAMCDRHAGSLTAPVGWSLQDSRTTALTLFPLTSVTAVPEAIEAVADSDVA